MREATPDQTAMGWAWRKARKHVSGFTVGTAAFTLLLYLTGAIFSLPSDPSWSQRTWNALANVGTAIAVVFGALMLFELAIAPYQQRNALRRREEDEARRDTERAVADLSVAVTVQHNNVVWLTVTNNGETDYFSAVLISSEEEEREKLRWEDFGKGPLEQLIVHRNFSFLPVLLGRQVWQLRSEHYWSVEFLPRVLKPTTRQYVARRTELGVLEVRSRESSWPKRPYAWFSDAAHVIHTLETALREVASSDAAAANEIWRGISGTFQNSEVVGPTLLSGFNAELRDAMNNKDIRPVLQKFVPQWTREMREAVRLAAAYNTALSA